MANLSTLIIQKSGYATERYEENLKNGQIYFFQPGSMYSSTGAYGSEQRTFYYCAPGNGTLEVELWGAGGSGAKMCCCGMGLPGNSSAYLKKTFTNVTSGAYLTGMLGISCGNASDLCYRGRSEASCILFCDGTSVCHCMCAEGGDGGYSVCSAGSASAYCCFLANYAVNTNTPFSGCCAFVGCNAGYSDGCGVICNTQCTLPLAYGGDFNWAGQYSKTFFLNCQGINHCYHYQVVQAPPGNIADRGVEVTFSGDFNSDYSVGGTGGWASNMTYALEAATKAPLHGFMENHCFSGRTCGCYEASGCVNFLPPGVGGPAPWVCDSVRDHGGRGGFGAVRIRFIRDE
jgi:hypothetical protein